MPISTHISLIPQADVTLRTTMGHHAHAAFLAILRETDPDRAETLHAQSAQKPFTVSPLIAKARQSRQTTPYPGRHRLQTPIHLP